MSISDSAIFDIVSFPNGHIARLLAFAKKNRTPKRRAALLAVFEHAMSPNILRNARRFTCYGPIRGSCNHAHKSRTTATACVIMDERYCRRLDGHTDRRIRAMTTDEANDMVRENAAATRRKKHDAELRSRRRSP